MPENTGVSVLESLMKIIGGMGGGTVIGFFAQKQAAKSSAVKEMQLLKKEYKEFAEFTKCELQLSREDRANCQRENQELRDEIGGLKIHVNEMTIAMHNAIGTPEDKRKGFAGK